MRVLLIAPTALDAKGDPIRESRLHLPGLTLPMLAAVTPREVDLTLVYETVQDIPYDRPWDLVGLTSMGSGIIRAWQIGDVFRQRGVPVVIGGIAASLYGPEKSLEHADSVVIGEAEETWPRLISDFQAGRMQQVYRAERHPPIDNLPPPRYDLMPRARLGLWRPVQATRGCPFTCSFCSVTTFFGQTYRKRPVEQVVRDVRLARRSGTRHIAFIDDNIGIDWDYCRELWTALIPEKIIWMSQCSLHIADHPDLLALAHRSGCRILSFGIESVNDTTLGNMNKTFNHPAEYERAIRTIRSHGIDVSTEMVVGMDGDDETVFERTYEFLMRNRISVPRIHIITPVPGTELYRQFEAQGRLTSVELKRFTGGNVVFKPAGIDPKILHDEYWNMYRRLFTWRGIFHRAWPNPAGLGLYMRAVVWVVNYRYRGHIHHQITPGIL